MNTKIAFLVIFFTFVQIAIINPLNNVYIGSIDEVYLNESVSRDYTSSSEYTINYSTDNVWVFIKSIWTGTTVVLWFILGLSFLPLVGSND